jgi:MFS superfamily sulfate permease-like transporter
MSTVDVMAIVLFLFFLVGVGVGVLVVVAWSVRRAGKAARRTGPAGPPPARWPYLPETDQDDDGPGKPSWRQARGGY